MSESSSIQSEPRSLPVLRSAIDAVDQKIVALLNERASLVSDDLCHIMLDCTLFNQPMVSV
jgi:Chorismate mutase type II